MRQVLVGTTKLVKDVSFSRAILSFDDDTLLSSGLNIVKIPFDIKPLHGAAIDFKFELTEDMGRKHIILVGAYYNPDTAYITVMLYNLANTAILVKDGTSIIIAGAFEVVMLRQVTEAKPEPTPKKNRKRK